MYFCWVGSFFFNLVATTLFSLSKRITMDNTCFLDVYINTLLKSLSALGCFLNVRISTCTLHILRKSMDPISMWKIHTFSNAPDVSWWYSLVAVAKQWWSTWTFFLCQHGRWQGLIWYYIYIYTVYVCIYIYDMWNLEVLIGGTFLYPSWQTNLLAAGFWDSILHLIQFKVFFPNPILVLLMTTRDPTI